MKKTKTKKRNFVATSNDIRSLIESLIKKENPDETQ